MESGYFHVEVPSVNLILGEILLVITLMKKNQRWQSTSSNVDSSLMQSFLSLKLHLTQESDISNIDAITLLDPFLQVITSPHVSGPITATALSSLDKFITYSILHPKSPNLALGITQLSSAATHCKFEASDSVSDELVLLNILHLLRNVITGKLGGYLSDESVCEMMETGLSMCCQMRLSEMLRRSAERTMQSMIASVFSKLKNLPAEKLMEDELNSTSSTDLELAATELKEGGVRMNVELVDIPAILETSTLISEKEDESEKAVVLESIPINDTLDVEDSQLIPFGIASIKELLRVLITLLNPHDQQHTDSMRLMALGLLNVAFEVGGKSIGMFPSLRGMVADELCKHLFQLARSDNVQLLSTSLRVIMNIFDTMRNHLKLQQELFLSFLIDRLVLSPSNIAPGLRKAELEAQLDAATWSTSTLELSSTQGSSTPIKEREVKESRGSLEAKELMMEVLSHLARGNYAMIDLWINYDCEVECEDLYERLIKFLSRGVFPSTQSGPFLQDNSQLLCLDTILEQIKQMSARLDDEPTQTEAGLTATELALKKSNKNLLLEGAAAFNLKPKTGLKFLEENGVIYSDSSISREESLARFFKTTPRLDKKLLGDFISRPDQLGVLKAFMGLMKFDGKIICDAMRELLEAFRLPGESQQIARITETFAEVYFATNPPDIKSQDATYVLSYSVIMLNTDLHNPQVRKRMDIAAYSRNLRGVNDNSDFSPEYLKSIYDSIRKREIVLPEEHQNQVGFEYGWKELLRRTRSAGLFAMNSSNEFDRSMFLVSWKPIVGAMTFAFSNFNDDYMVQRTILGFNQCAILGAKYEMTEVFDYLIESLSLISDMNLNKVTDYNNLIDVQTQGAKITISPISIKLGTNLKSQLALVILFTIANNNSTKISDSWQFIWKILINLFSNSLLPAKLLLLEDFLSGESVIPLKPIATAAVAPNTRQETGLLSTLSSYLLSPYSNADQNIIDYTDDDVEITLSAVDCIASCKIDELYSQIFELRGSALIAPVTSLIALAQKITTDKLRSKAPIINTLDSNNSPTISTSSRIQLPYDPSAVLLLEILASIVAKSKSSISDLWPLAFDFISKLLANAGSFSSLFNERVVAALLRLSLVVIKEPELRDSTFLALDMLRSLPPPVLASVAEPLMTGLSKLFIENADRIHSSTEWNLIFALFTATLAQEEAAKLSFDLMKKLASGQLGTGLRFDNYASFLQVLAGFANVVKSSSNVTGPSDEPAMQRGRQIVDILSDTQAAIPQLITTSTLSAPKAWESCWIPLLSAYAQLCLNPSRELRQIAIGSLQRTLLSPEILTNNSVDLTIIFERVFFPLLEELLKPQVFRRDPDGMGETRLRGSALLCKIFLQYLTQLEERGGMGRMTELWLKILSYQDRFMHSGRRDQMFEAVPESLKNVLLVMNASGFLLPPFENRNAEQVLLWDSTFERILPFLPNLKDDLFPEPKRAIPFVAVETEKVIEELEQEKATKVEE